MLFVSGCATGNFCDLYTTVYVTENDVTTMSQGAVDATLANNTLEKRICK